MKTDPCRFCRLYGLSLVPIATLLGLVLSLQLALEQQQYGRAQAAAPIVLGSALRGLAPAANGSALMIALVLWAHPLSVAALQADLQRILKRALTVSLPGFLLAFVVSLSVCFAVLHWGLGAATRDFSAGLRALGPAGFGFGALATLVDAAFVLFAAWRFLGRMQASRMSLPGKLVLSWTVLFPLRAFLGLVLESVLPG